MVEKNIRKKGIKIILGYLYFKSIKNNKWYINNTQKFIYKFRQLKNF